MYFLFFFFLCRAVAASGVREFWIWQELNHGYPVTESGKLRDSASLYISAISKTAFVETRALLDARYFEVAIGGTHIFFPGKGELTRELESEWQPRHNGFSVEVARFYPTGSGHFGRLGAQLITFLPTPDAYLRLHMNTGIMEQSTWGVQLRPALLFGLTHKRSFLAIGSQVTMRAFDELAWVFGVKTDLQFRLSDIFLVENAPHEHMLISAGPLCRLELKTLSVELGLRWHLRIDQQSDGLEVTQSRTLNMSPDASASAIFAF
jgi:hypothetical protein